MAIFFEKAPALYYGLALLIGIESALFPTFWYFLPASFLFSSVWPYRERIFLGIGILAIGSVFGWMTNTYISIPENGIRGAAFFEPTSLQLKKNRFGENWQYLGKLISFTPLEEENLKIKDVSAILNLKNNKSLQRPKAAGVFVIPCRLYPLRGQKYLIKSEKEKDWGFQKKLFSFTEWRFKAKSFIKAAILEIYPSKKAGSFLAGLATGEFDDHEMKNAFRRFGLLHLMAISGFHFSLLAAILRKGLQLIFSPLKTAVLLLILLTIYFFFLGSSASILRAYLTIFCLYGAEVFKTFGNSLNAFGVALLFSLLYDPLLCSNLGFQFSFLITAGILLIYEPLEKVVEKIFPRRKPEEIAEFSLRSKHALILLGYFRSALALNLATTCVALPLALFSFQTFPLLSIFYNLFFPLLVSISIFLFLMGSFFYFVPFLGSLVHAMNNSFTSYILRMTEEIPQNFDICLTFKDLPVIFLLFYYTIIFWLFIRFSVLNKKITSKIFYF